MKIKIKEEQARVRIDKFLAQKLKIARNQIQSQIQDNLILVNKQKTKANYILREGDEVEILDSKKLKTQDLQENNFCQKNKKNSNFKKIKIIKETKNFLILNKPAGLLVHPTRSRKHEETLVDFLLERYPKIKNVGDDQMRPGIVHRLDRDVSGLMVIALTQEFFIHLKKQFQNRTVNKEYLALVYGQISTYEGEIKFPLKRASSGHKMVALPTQSINRKLKNPTPRQLEFQRQYNDARDALTKYKLLKKFINYSLLHIVIHTGRTHQIRVHLAALDHPVVGDDLYGTRKTKAQNIKLNLGRLFLVSCDLGFLDLDGVRQEFKIDLPKELQKMVRGLK